LKETLTTISESCLTDFAIFMNNGNELQSYVMFHLLWRG